LNDTPSPPSVAIVGRPNVGKSALFNRLIGRKIAIVHDQAGITRDRLSALCIRGAQPFQLWDTGGIIGGGETELAAQVRRSAENALRQSDLILFVVDAHQGLSPMDEELARLLRRSKKAVVLAINKIDNARHEALAAEFDSLGFSRAVSVSAEHNRGIAELFAQFDSLLPAKDIKPQALDASPARTRALAIAILGRPNVGKSSFINAIMQSERAIVSELPGTTRDAIDILYEQDGQQFVFIDTAGIRRRGKHSSSVEVFSVMRAERSIRRAELCVLIVDLTTGVTAQDKRIAGLVQEAHKGAIVVLNKWDLFKPKRGEKHIIPQLADEAREQLFFIDYAPVLVASAQTGENVDRLFRLIAKMRRESRAHIGTGVLNRLLRAAFAANPPPLKSGKRLKLFYAAQANSKRDRELNAPEFVLFLNDPRLLSDRYRRYLEARIREARPYAGLPIILTLRSREHSRGR
jgi:GTP-binding protein